MPCVLMTRNAHPPSAGVWLVPDLSRSLFVTIGIDAQGQNQSFATEYDA